MPWKPKWLEGNVRTLLAPVLILTHFFGLTSPASRSLTLFAYGHRIIIFGLCMAIFIHEIPSISFWQKNSEVIHSSKINAIIESLKSKTSALPKSTQRKIFRFNLVHVLLNIGVITIQNILGHDVVWPNINYTPFTSTIYIFNDLLILICAFEFIHIINLINEIFKQINYKIKSIKEKIKSGRKTNLEVYLKRGEIVRLREVHLFLTKICAEVNSCFSVQILLLIFFSMVEIIYSLRSIVGDFSVVDVEERILNLATDIFWFLPFTLTLLQLIAFSERTSAESRKTIIVVHYLINLHHYDRNIVKELEIFAMQIKQHPVVFSVRFFNLDYFFLNTVISSLATYFIIIVTFQGETDSSGLVDWNFKMPTTTEETTSL